MERDICLVSLSSWVGSGSRSSVGTVTVSCLAASFLCSVAGLFDGGRPWRNSRGPVYRPFYCPITRWSRYLGRVYCMYAGIWTWIYWGLVISLCREYIFPVLFLHQLPVQHAILGCIALDSCADFHGLHVERLPVLFLFSSLLHQ